MHRLLQHQQGWAVFHAQCALLYVHTILIALEHNCSYTIEPKTEVFCCVLSWLLLLFLLLFKIKEINRHPSHALPHRKQPIDHSLTELIQQQKCGNWRKLTVPPPQGWQGALWHFSALLCYFSIRRCAKFSSYTNQRVPSHLSLQFPHIHIMFSEHDYSLQVLKHPRNKWRLLCYRTASPWLGL